MENTAGPTNLTMPQPPTGTQPLTIEARADQLEAAINEAMERAATIAVYDVEVEVQSDGPGALSVLDRCQAKMQRLNGHLAHIQNIAGRIA